MTTKNKIIVTIGREFGSGGHEVGKRLANLLNINFYDKEFIKMTMEKTGFAEEYIKNNEEKAPGFASNALFSGMDLYTLSPSDRIHEAEIKIIKKITAKESCVIVGRTADFLLKDQSHVSIFIFAPIEDRIKRKMALLDSSDARNITPAMMEKMIKQIDKQRKRHYEYYTDNKWGSRDTYDLLINTQKTGIDGAVKIIKTYIDESRGESLMPD